MFFYNFYHINKNDKSEKPKNVEMIKFVLFNMKI